MRRVFAAILAVSVCFLQAQTLAFHVHRAPDHATSQRHTHGPAIHHHGHSDESAGDANERPRFTTRNERVDAITLTMPVAASLTIAMAAEVPSHTLSFEQLHSSAPVLMLEVRSHGPPATWRPAFRGPPPFLPV